MGNGHKGPARKKMRKYGKGRSPMKKTSGAPRDGHSSKVAIALLDKGKKFQTASNCINNTDTSKTVTNKFKIFSKRNVFPHHFRPKFSPHQNNFGLV